MTDLKIGQQVYHRYNRWTPEGWLPVRELATVIDPCVAEDPDYAGQVKLHRFEILSDTFVPRHCIDLPDMIFDQFTRWHCPHCHGDGIDSWNKAMFDGRDGSVEDPLILGDTCARCLWPVATCYTTPDTPPRVIMGGALHDYAFENEAFRRLQEDPQAGITLAPAETRDGDWSQGCRAAQGMQP